MKEEKKIETKKVELKLGDKVKVRGANIEFVIDNILTNKDGVFYYNSRVNFLYKKEKLEKIN